jgi:hypothetical protein
MDWTALCEGIYEGGWTCSGVGGAAPCAASSDDFIVLCADGSTRDGAGEVERWWCEACSEDLCEACGGGSGDVAGEEDAGFAAGSAVLLHGLKGRAELNGTQGSVVSGPEGSKGSYRVRVRCGGVNQGILKINPANLALVGGAPEQAAAAAAEAPQCGATAAVAAPAEVPEHRCFWEAAECFSAAECRAALHVLDGTVEAAERVAAAAAAAAAVAASSSTELQPAEGTAEVGAAEPAALADATTAAAAAHAKRRREAFSGVPRCAATEWIYARMEALAARADRESGWGLLAAGGGHGGGGGGGGGGGVGDDGGAAVGDGGGSSTTAVDELIFDRFGPAFSATEFRWHCDALPSDPARRVSVVAYFTPPAAYEGGVLQMKVPPVGAAAASAACGAGADEVGGGGGGGGGARSRVLERRYEAGWAVAFASTSLEHGVTPVTAGERRSLLLIVGSKVQVAQPGVRQPPPPPPPPAQQHQQHQQQKQNTAAAWGLSTATQ